MQLTEMPAVPNGYRLPEPPLRILLVEDNELNSDMLMRRLRRRGWAVELAVSGKQGLEMALSASPDLILMDMSLPELDGWTATRILREDPATCSIPVIALTAHAMSGDRERALEAGCSEFETKPVDFARLTGLIERLAGKSTETPQAGKEPTWLQQ